MVSIADSPICINGPSFVAKLSAFDARHGPVESRRILIFKSNSPPQPVIDVFVPALTHLLQKAPILAGRTAILDKQSNPTGQAKWSTLVPGDGALLYIRDLRSKIKFSELEAANYAPELLPEADVLPTVAKPRAPGSRVAEFALSFIDGGILFSTCVSHIATDGTGLTHLLDLLACYCKTIQDKGPAALLQEHPLSPPLGLDRTGLLGLRKPGGSKEEDFPAYAALPPDTVPTLDPGIKDFRLKFYRLKHDSLVRLKADATSSRISTGDAIASLVWRANVVNRIAAGAIDVNDPTNQTTRFYYPVSMRTAMGLGSEYTGNQVVWTMATMSLNDMLAADCLPKAAARIRAAVQGVDKDMILGITEIIETLHSPGAFWLSLGWNTTNNDIITVSCFHSEIMFQRDWGDLFGNRALRLRTSGPGFTGFIGSSQFILPRLPDEQGGEVQFSVYWQGIKAMEEDEIFSRYFETQ